MNRVYTAEQRQEAVGLALRIGQRKAAHQLGIPQRTLSAWQTGFRHAEVAPPIVLATNQEVAEKYSRVIDSGADELLRRITDPRARLGDIARAVEVATQTRALISGGATSRSENLNINAEWEPEEYRSAPTDLREVANDLMRDILREVVDGYKALELAGVTTGRIEVDGLTARAKLDGPDAARVRHLLGELQSARAAGRPAAQIIDDLATGKLGAGDVG